MKGKPYQFFWVLLQSSVCRQLCLWWQLCLFWQPCHCRELSLCGQGSFFSIFSLCFFISLLFASFSFLHPLFSWSSQFFPLDFSACHPCLQNWFAAYKQCLRAWTLYRTLQVSILRNNLFSNTMIILTSNSIQLLFQYSITHYQMILQQELK